MPVAAVLHEIEDEIPHGFRLGRITYGAAFANTFNETGLSKNGELRGERIWRWAEVCRDIAGRNTVRTRPYKQAENGQPAGLGKSRKAGNGCA